MSFDESKWVSGNKIYVVGNSPSERTDLFFNAYTGDGPPEKTWHKVDVSDLVHPDTKAVHLTGILIITRGTTSEVANLRIYFRKNNDYDPTIPGRYKHQAIEASSGGGQRSTMSTWVPLNDDLTFEYRWEGDQKGSYPTYSAYGANLVIDAFLTGE